MQPYAKKVIQNFYRVILLLEKYSVEDKSQVLCALAILHAEQFFRSRPTCTHLSLPQVTQAAQTTRAGDLNPTDLPCLISPIKGDCKLSSVILSTYLFLQQFPQKAS